MNDEDAGMAFDRAAARAARQESVATTGGFRWIAERRYRAALGRLLLVVFLLPAHVVAERQVTGWLVAHLAVIAVLASQLVTRWLARHDDHSPHLVPPA